MSLILISGCPNHKIRHELRAFQRSEVSLSFELERVLDRNIGIVRSSADEDFCTNQ